MTRAVAAPPATSSTGSADSDGRVGSLTADDYPARPPADTGIVEPQAPMIRDRLKKLLKDRLGAGIARAETWAPEPTTGTGRPELPSGRRLERSVLATVDEIANATRRPGRLTLLHNWATWAPAVEADVPLLLELHLSWAQHVDFIGIGWELLSGSPALEDAALDVDAFHRDFGLTWRTLICQGTRDRLRDALHLRSELLPTTLLRDREGKIVFLQEGALDEQAIHELEAFIRQLTGVVDRPRAGF